MLSANIETQIKKLNGKIIIVRLGGKDRYETSMKIIDYFKLPTNTITVATGINFPDALSGSVLSARKSCAVLLVDNNNKDITKQKELLNIQKITNLIVFGGADVVSNDIANSLAGITPVISTTLPKMSYVGLGNKLLVGDTRTFTVVSANYTGMVQYRAFINNNNESNWHELTNGYTVPVNAKTTICLPPTYQFNVGNYTLVVLVKRAGTRGTIITPNYLGWCDTFNTFGLSCKGGVLGTSGKGVVALRFDDYQNIFGTKIYPLLLERGLPASMALISRFNTEQPWGKNTTWNQVREWNKNGVEIWSHGTDHKDYTSKGYAGLYDEIVTSKKEIENQGIKVVGFVLPGVAPSNGSTIPLYNSLTKSSDYNSVVGKLITNTYYLSEAYAYPAQRTLPTDIYHGLSHVTVSDDATLAASIANKTGIELMCHSGNLGLKGNITISQFATILDYVKNKWDEGKIEILTPSGLAQGGNFNTPPSKIGG